MTPVDRLGRRYPAFGPCLIQGVKGEAINRAGGDAVQRALFGDDAASDIHLTHQSAAKDFAGRVGVGRHGERAKGEVAAWFLRRGFIVRKVR